MTRRAKRASIVTAIAVAGILLASWLIIGRGFNARETPGAVETFVARRLRSMMIPREAKNAQNPAPASSETLSEAMEHFADHCAICHANDGSGDASIGNGLYPKPPDLRMPDTQRLTDGELFYIIHNGVPLTGMPAFGSDEPGADLDSWKLVRFIRHLPQITPEELEKMETMNPKSLHELQEEEAIRRFLEGDDSPPAGNHKHD